MSERTDPVAAARATPTVAPPTKARLAKTTALALAIASVLLVTVVLPAEYAIDPLGTGRWLGLTEIAAPSVKAVDEPKPAGALLKPAVAGPRADYPSGFKLDYYEVTLQPYDYVEYKYRLEQGASMFYSWSATAAVLHDFHGERAGATGTAAEESFDKQQRQQASGSLAAPFAGIHGWYWENPGSVPVTIRLSSSGFYTSAVEIRSDRSRRNPVLRAADSLRPPPVPPAAPRPSSPSQE
jgi:hypothetical protein